MEVTLDPQDFEAMDQDVSSYKNQTTLINGGWPIRMYYTLVSPCEISLQLRYKELLKLEIFI